MAKTKIAISIDEELLELIDRQRGNEKRSTYINSLVSEHFSASPSQRGGATFVTTLELRKTLKPIFDRLVTVEGLRHDIEEMREIIRTK